VLAEQLLPRVAECATRVLVCIDDLPGRADLVERRMALLDGRVHQPQLALGLLALADVLREHEDELLVLEGDVAAQHVDGEDRTVLAAMTGLQRDVVIAFHALPGRLPYLRRK